MIINILCVLVFGFWSAGTAIGLYTVNLVKMKVTQSQNQLQEWMSQLKHTQKLGVVMFETEGSGVVRIMRSIFAELIKENAPKLELISCDLDEHPDLAASFQICELPTMLFFSKDKLEARFQGLTPKHELVSKINSLLA